MIYLYFILIIIIGLYKSNYKNDDDYLFASRKITLPSFVATLVTTWYGGILEIGRFSYQNGIVTWIIFGLYYYIAALIYGFYIGPILYKNNISSIPNYFKKYYGIIPGKFVAIIVILISSPAPYLMILSTLLMHIFNINIHLSIILGIFFSTIYLYIGGFKSIIKTDKIQFILMFSGFIIMIYYLMSSFGGINFLLAHVPEKHLSISGKLPLGYILSWSLISMITFIDPSIFQRAYSSKNSSVIKYGILTAILFWFIFDIMTITVGLYAAAIIDVNSLIGNPYLMLADSILPTFFKTIFYISLLSVVMSTIDSFTFVSAFTISKDLLYSKNLYRGTQFGLLITAIISYCIILNFKQVIDIWYIFGSIAASSILIPFLTLIFTPNKRLRVPMIVMLIPFFTAVIWIILDYPFNIDSMYPGFLSSCILCYLFLDSNSSSSTA